MRHKADDKDVAAEIIQTAMKTGAMLCCKCGMLAQWHNNKESYCFNCGSGWRPRRQKRGR